MAKNIEYSIRGDPLEQHRIRGDPLEQHRIQLEHGLQHTDLSLHLSTGDYSDVEFPRHNSSRDHDPWSYRTDDDGPYIADTISTAAHHASALTLSAGLGGRGARRDISVSGAEYDPDRPVPGIHSSAFDLNSKFPSMTAQFDPLVVDDSADLDLTNRQVAALRSSSSSSSSSRPNTPLSPRPKLSDALHSVSFSPKRPRNVQPIASKPPRPRVPRKPSVTVVQDDDAPRAHNSSYQQSLSYAAPMEPEVNVHPPTPPTAENTSRFTRMARGLTRELEAEQTRFHPPDVAPTAQSTIRKPAKPRQLREQKSHVVKTPFRDRVHLPDVTGLTSAIASPGRIDWQYLGYDAKDDGEIDARLVHTLSIVHSKLKHLESENSISRRRVRELELELEECKKEVALERTKVLEREQIITQQQRDRLAQSTTKTQEEESRYKEAVEEKKALEALIATLRTHLTRLTSELSHHSVLLEELRTLRDSDVRALKEKSRDVDQLRQEVERLAGEVEVLRGVVEEGLKERREVREQSMERSREGSSRHSSHSKSILQEIDDANKTHAGHLMDGSESEDDGSSSGRSTPSPTPSPCHNRTRTARTDAATVASSSPGTGTNGLTSESRPFLHTEELERISEELSDRRVEQSASASTISLQHQQQRPRSQLSVNRGGDGSPVGWVRRSVSVSGHHRPRGKGNGDSDAEGSNAAAVASAPPVPPPAAPTTNRVGSHHQQQQYRERPSQQPKPHQKRSFTELHEKHPAAEGPRAPLPAVAPAPSTETETPFPQIRGAQLERLFFSAPEHNAETCTVCHRRARNRYGHEDAQHDGDDRRNLGQRFRDAETEGEGEGGHGVGKGRGKGKERDCAEGQERVPPQTVVVRVLRELEDDFTHYKGIYVELADQYRIIDAVSNVAKRNVLAGHLKDVIDILEQKVREFPPSGPLDEEQMILSQQPKWGRRVR
ncbi:hypothetical protein PHLCEN_2v3557 [Hermanssonia centrifuga]|uniref:Cep57 centrosome microtubule-binding domain-containing protein n=1 Tax=Hermanssonia centrifuga TaxID=98765 RepID=A0A2R6QET1_9APHY|nr:hypothetical protein PHLCEN_2v3557 [Hermanssonia centrifuga]